MALSGILQSRVGCVAVSAAVLYALTASGPVRFSLNCEISAPALKAFSPSPRMTISRTSGSAQNASSTVGMDSHISYDVALWRAGLLKMIQPIAPSFFAISLSVSVCSGATGWFISAYHEHRNLGVSEYLRGLAAEQHAGEAAAPVRRHED